MYYRHDLTHRQYVQWESNISIHECAYHRSVMIAEARLAADGNSIVIHAPSGRELYRDIPRDHMRKNVNGYGAPKGRELAIAG